MEQDISGNVIAFKLHSDKQYLFELVYKAYITNSLLSDDDM